MTNLFVFLKKISVLLPIILLLAGCTGEDKPEKIENRKSIQKQDSYNGIIAAVGDSLTAGLGVYEEESYPAQLQRKLKRDGYRYQVINAGVSGETSSGTLSRFDWIMTMNPDVVILEIGANDGLRGLDTNIPRQNLMKILHKLQEKNVVTVFTGMKMVWNMGEEYTTAYNAIYPEIAEQFDVIFMPFFLEGVAMVPELNSEDGLHPNKDGYSVVVRNLYPYVINALERLERNRVQKSQAEQ